MVGLFADVVNIPFFAPVINLIQDAVGPPLTIALTQM
jgi:hypothetical protein